MLGTWVSSLILLKCLGAHGKTKPSHAASLGESLELSCHYTGNQTEGKLAQVADSAACYPIQTGHSKMTHSL